MRRAAVLGALVVFALGALFVVRPFVATQRDQPAEIVSPASLSQTDVVPLARRHPVCFANAVIEHHSEIIRFKVYSPTGPAPALAVHIVGPGYDYTAQIPAGTPDNTLVSAAVPAAPTDLPVEVCFTSRGKPAIALFASNDRTRSRSIASVDGTPTGNGMTSGRSVWFGFYEATPKAITERVPATLSRMTVFRPGYVTRGVLWVLLVLLVVGVPVGIVWAYQRALRDDERTEPRELDVNRRRTRWQRFVG
jgi:hypothetical protein